VKVGGRTEPATPFETLRSAMATPRPDAFQAADAGTGASCPFAASLGDAAAAATPAQVRWEPAAEARLERIPGFIRPMARRSIERFAEERGYASISESVMDEARSVFGM
jgi:hypothetical protein